MKKMMACLALVASMAVVTLSAQCRYVAPDADEWVEKNRSMLDTLTRAGWLDLDEGYKQAAVFEFTPEQITDLWIGKINQVLSDFKWTRAERKHIERMRTWFLEHPNTYSDKKTKEEQDKTIRFIEDWTSYAKTKLGWTDKLIFGIAVSCNDLLDKEGNLKTTAKVEVQPMKADSLSKE